MSLTRMRRKPWTFALYALIRGLTYVTLAVLLVAVWELGVILIASLTSAIIVFVVSAREYVRDLIRGVDWGVGKEMIAFGWPTIVSAFSFYALNLLDRQAPPRRRGDRAVRSRLPPLQPDRARRSLRLPHGVAVVALHLAQQRPPPADGGPWRELVLRGTRLPGRARLRGSSRSSTC